MSRNTVLVAVENGFTTALSKSNFESEVLMAVTIKNGIFWVVALSSSKTA
jgi:hypothetical protein